MKPVWRLAGCVLAVAVLAACSNTPPPPDWAVAADGAVRRATAAELDGVQRVATVEWAMAERETARTADPARLARLALVRCALAQASLALGPCVPYQALAADATPADQAYARFLAGQAAATDLALLPPWHRPIAQAIAQAVAQPGPDPAAAAPTVPALPALPEDPLARLVAASVLWQGGWASAELLATAVDTAAAQGWRRPLLAWLQLQVRWAQGQGDQVLAAQAQRRLTLLEASGPAARP